MKSHHLGLFLDLDLGPQSNGALSQNDLLGLELIWLLTHSILNPKVSTEPYVNVHPNISTPLD